ncbi:retrovirus-related pol polyprotein from transposon TNT 1-94, partial [Tanacetum coccineum]
GIEIVPHVSDILLSQKKYILELLQSAGLSNCNPVSSPMATSSSLTLDDSIAFSNLVKYQQVVGSLQYVTLSQPDIAFAVNKVCQYMHAPTENHCRSSGSTLQAFTDVLWKGNPDISLEAFSDADWAGDSDDRRSTRGFAIYLGLLVNNVQFQVPLQKLNTSLLLTLLLSSHDFKLFLMSLESVHLQLLYYGVTILRTVRLHFTYDSPVEEDVSPVKPKNPSRHATKAKKDETKEVKEPPKEWTVEEEIALCQGWCDVSKNSISGEG